MSLPISEGFSRVGAGTPNAMVAFVEGMSYETALGMSAAAVHIAQEWMPKVSGSAARSLRPVAYRGYYGISWGRSYIRHLEHGTRPRTMTSLAGKTIPMWVDDQDGSRAAKMSPKDRATLTRTTEDGRRQIKIFRKAAPIGSRKWIEREGRRVSVPRHYPGAPGRIRDRTEDGRIAPGNVGVWWRHPGTKGRDYIGDALDYVAHTAGVKIYKQEVTVARHSLN